MRTLITLLLGLLQASLLQGSPTTFIFENKNGSLTSTVRWTENEVWKNATTNSCYQRYYGVGMASPSTKKGASGIIACWDDAPLAVHMVKVDCYISSKTPANKELTLSLTANYVDEHVEEQSISFVFAKEEVSTLDEAYPLTLYFTLPYQESLVRSLMLQNQTEGAYIFEVGKVSLSLEAEPLEVDAEVFATGVENRAVAIVKSIAGGSGSGYSYCWSTENETSPTYTTENGYSQFSFVHSGEEGEYRATLTVCDSAMNVFTKTYTFVVGALKAPRILEISDIKRSSFKIRWENGSTVAPRYYSLAVRQPLKSIEEGLTPQWSVEGDWATTKLEISLPIKGFEDVSSLIVNAEGWTTGMMFELSEDGETWTSLTYNDFLGGVLLTPALKGFERLGGPYYLRVSSEFARTSLILSGEIRPIFEERTFVADGLVKECLVDELPASSMVEVYLKTVFPNKQTMQADVQKVQLAPLPPFQQVSVYQSYLFPIWPEGVQTARIDYYAEIPPKCEGLYLTRVFYGTGSSGGKGIVLSNTSAKGIDLSNYSLRKVTTNGSVAITQFADIFLPARSEILFVYSIPNFKLEMTANVMGGAMNFANKAELSLIYDDKVVNSLPVKTAHVTRLGDSGIECFSEAYDEALTLPSLWMPWGQGEVIHLGEELLTLGDVMVGVPVAGFRQKYPFSSRIFARIVSVEGEAVSLPYEVEVWRRRLGYGLLLR